jgi:hypothetical protein
MCWVPWLSLRPGGFEVQQIGFLSSFPLFYLKTEAESSFRNVVVLLFCNLDDGRSPKNSFTHYNAPSSETFRLRLEWLPLLLLFREVSAWRRWFRQSLHAYL